MGGHQGLKTSECSDESLFATHFRIRNTNTYNQGAYLCVRLIAGQSDVLPEFDELVKREQRSAADDVLEYT